MDLLLFCGDGEIARIRLSVGFGWELRAASKLLYQTLFSRPSGKAHSGPFLIKTPHWLMRAIWVPPATQESKLLGCPACFLMSSEAWLDVSVSVAAHAKGSRTQHPLSKVSALLDFKPLGNNSFKDWRAKPAQRWISLVHGHLLSITYILWHLSSHQDV